MYISYDHINLRIAAEAPKRFTNRSVRLKSITPPELITVRKTLRSTPPPEATIFPGQSKEQKSLYHQAK